VEVQGAPRAVVRHGVAAIPLHLLHLLRPVVAPYRQQVAVEIDEHAISSCALEICACVYVQSMNSRKRGDCTRAHRVRQAGCREEVRVCVSRYPALAAGCRCVARITDEVERRPLLARTLSLNISISLNISRRAWTHACTSERKHVAGAKHAAAGMGTQMLEARARRCWRC